MKKLFYVLFAGLIISCDKSPKSLGEFRSNFFELQQHSIQMGDTLNVSFGAHQDKIDSVVLLLDGKRFQNGSALDPANAVLGLNPLVINLYSGKNLIKGDTQIGVLNDTAEEPVEFEVIKTYPHPSELFTQGFFYHDGLFYESGGQYGSSKMVAYRPGMTTYAKVTELGDRFFAEGATLHKGKVYQLTYRERKVFVYDPKTLELLETLDLPQLIREGWGMTSDGEHLIVTDGTQKIRFFDDQMNLIREIQNAGNRSIYDNLNEMEYINGRIYVNVWLTNYVLVINPENGAVEKYLDLKDISERKGSDDTANGIALYNGNLLLTGKNWEKIYEIPLPN